MPSTEPLVSSEHRLSQTDFGCDSLNPFSALLAFSSHAPALYIIQNSEINIINQVYCV